jgi:hypothetical protein
MNYMNKEKRLNEAIEKFVDEISFLWENEAIEGDETESIAFRVLDELDRQNGNIVDRKDEEGKLCMIKTWVGVENEAVELYTKEEGEEEIAQLREAQPENIYRLVEW